MKKDAPKLSAKDVPGALRPLMSCALWRLHESIDRNDPNQLFLLSDQTEIRSVAQKLNIAVRSCKEVGATIASKTYKIDLDSIGDLEREFGVRQKVANTPTQDPGEMNGEKYAPDSAVGGPKDVDVVDHSMSSEDTMNTEASSIGHEQELKKQSSELEEEKSLVNCDLCEDNLEEQAAMPETAVTVAAENVSKAPAMSVESAKSLVDNIIQHVSQKRPSGPVNDLKTSGTESQTSLANAPALGNSSAHPPPSTPLPRPRSLETAQRVEEVQTISDTSTSKHTATPLASPMGATQEPEDSDEEVVVFVPQPKRLSAQQKPAQQNSRPSTPKEQSQQRPVGQSPQKSWGKSQPKGISVRHSPNPSIVGQNHSQSINSPTVIDPDAFGRDFRVNLNPSPRLPHNPNGHSNHRVRGNMQNAQVGQVARNSPRQPARTSPPRNAPQENSQRLTPGPVPATKNAPNHRRQASRTSPRRGPSPNGEEMTPTIGKATTAAGLSKSQLPGPQTLESTKSESEIAIALPNWNTPSSTDFESATAGAGPNSNQSQSTTDFVPRSALPNAGFKPPRIYDASEFVPRPSRPVREGKPRQPNPKVFEAAEFVPRDFVPRTTTPRVQPKQYSPEPEFIEPRPSINDVDYVLKSGSTRASARGKGRLWTPS